MIFRQSSSPILCGDIQHSVLYDFVENKYFVRIKLWEYYSVNKFLLTHLFIRTYVSSESSWNNETD